MGLALRLDGEWTNVGVRANSVEGEGHTTHKGSATEAKKASRSVWAMWATTRKQHGVDLRKAARHI